MQPNDLLHDTTMYIKSYIQTTQEDLGLDLACPCQGPLSPSSSFLLPPLLLHPAVLDHQEVVEFLEYLVFRNLVQDQVVCLVEE